MRSKYCDCCGREFFKRPRDSESQWERRVFCSVSCRNKSTRPEPIHIRFWKYVDQRGDSECWLWTGAKDGRGYGNISVGAGESPAKAYRISYEMRYGPIPDGLLIRHRCDNPACVNPRHLETGTQKDNARDMVQRNRQNPKSLLNLRPGAQGFHGAGPQSNGERYGTRS